MNITSDSITSTFDKIAISVLKCFKNTACNKGVSDDTFSDFPVISYLLRRCETMPLGLEILLTQRLIDLKNALLTNEAEGTTFSVPFTRSVRRLVPLLTEDMMAIYPFHEMRETAFDFGSGDSTILRACNYNTVGRGMDKSAFVALLDNALPLKETISAKDLAVYILLEQFYVNMRFLRPEMKLVTTEDEHEWFVLNPDVFYVLSNYKLDLSSHTNVVRKLVGDNKTTIIVNYHQLVLSSDQISLCDNGGDLLTLKLTGHTFVLDHELFNAECAAKFVLFDDGAFTLVLLFPKSITPKEMDLNRIQIELKNCVRSGDSFVKLENKNVGALLISNKGSRGVLDSLYNVTEVTFSNSQIYFKGDMNTKIVNLGDGIITMK